MRHAHPPNGNRPLVENKDHRCGGERLDSDKVSSRSGAEAAQNECDFFRRIPSQLCQIIGAEISGLEVEATPTANNLEQVI
jgi:hypothetical protein